MVDQAHHDRFLSELAELQVRIAVTESDLLKQIAISRALIKESRDLMARADNMLSGSTLIGPPK